MEIKDTTKRGIDYGNGMTNKDRDTGIRYGVISQNDVLQAWADSSDVRRVSEDARGEGRRYCRMRMRRRV
jgi:hypothetical protein